MSSHLILLVEDDQTIRTFLAGQLAADGYEILIAHGRRHALQLLAAHQPQLVLADVNGETLGLLDAVRGGDGLAGAIDPDTPMIVLTGRADELERVRVFDRGGDDVVTKPFSYPELRGRIRVLLRRVYERSPAEVSRVGSLTISRSAREVRVGGRRVEPRTEGVRAAGHARRRADTGIHPRGAAAQHLGVRDVRAHEDTGLARWSPATEARRGRTGTTARDQRVVDRLSADRWATAPERGGGAVSAGRVPDLYRDLALHRVGEAIDKLGASPTDRLAAQSAEALEEEAAALACMTALYTSPGGTLDERWQAQIDQLIGAAASLEQLADVSRRCCRPSDSDR